MLCPNDNNRSQGAENLKRDIECMIGKKPDLFWKVWFISWKYVCPLVLIVNCLILDNSICQCK